MNTDEIDDKESARRGWFGRLRRRRISGGERALIAAHGKALAVLATVLQANGHLNARRFAGMMSLFGVVVSEEDDLQGAILAMWADTINQSLDAIEGAADPA